MYPTTSLFIAVGQVAIAILVMFSYPLQVHPCRNCLDKVFHAGQPAKPVIAAGDGDDDDDDELEDEHHASHDMTPLKHTILTVAIVAGGFSIAYFVDDLKMGESTAAAPGSIPLSYMVASAVVRRFYWVDYHLVHPAWPFLVEGQHSPNHAFRIQAADASSTQLSRDDPTANKTLSRASLGLAIYGVFVFVFW